MEGNPLCGQLEFFKNKTGEVKYQGIYTHRLCISKQSGSIDQPALTQCQMKKFFGLYQMVLIEPPPEFKRRILSSKYI